MAVRTGLSHTASLFKPLLNTCVYLCILMLNRKSPTPGSRGKAEGVRESETEKENGGEERRGCSDKSPNFIFTLFFIIWQILSLSHNLSLSFFFSLSLACSLLQAQVEVQITLLP